MTFKHLFAIPLCLLPGLASAEVLSDTNPTIRSNLCVGGACAVNESFSTDFNQLKLKSAVNRIEFEDTSITSGFPTADWALQANESFNGQRDQFMLQDLSNGTTPLTVSAAAPTNAFFVAPDGDVGLGTSLPQARLNMVTATSSAIRIDRTDIGAGGGPSYEIGIEDFGNFAIKRPTSEEGIFSLSAGAPDLTQVIGTTVTSFNTGRHDYDFEVRGESLAPLIYADAGTTRVGIGTGTPAAPLHVTRADGSAEVLVENTPLSPSAPRGLFTMRNNGGSFFTHENSAPNRFIIADGVTDGPEFSLTAEGDITIPGSFISGATTLNVPDYVFDDGYALRPLSEVASFIDAHSHLPDVPSAAQIADTGLDMTAMQMALLKKVEELTLYTLEQEARLARMNTLEMENAALSARLKQIEAALAIGR